MAKNLARLAAYFPTESTRTGELTVSTRLAVRDALLSETRALRMGAVAYAVDVATGQAMGMAALAGDRWVVTTDMDIRLIRPVDSGELRVDAEVVRAGETTVVATFTLHDGQGAVVGGGTATGRPFPFTFDRALLGMRVGESRGYAFGEPAAEAGFVEHFGLRVAEGGAAEVDIADWLRNPWGILHGGVTSCLVDLAAASAGGHALGRPAAVTGATIRFLAPGRVGPAQAAPQVQVVDGDRALVEVRVTDAGAERRLLAVASATVG
jgi:uncharacterized protein (TIGR00369 family)